MPKVLEFEGVSLSIGSQKILQDATFFIEKGDFVGMIGPNGAGKTTIVKIALGLIKPDFGKVSLFENGLEEFREWWKIGYVPQRAAGFAQDFPASVLEVASMGRVAKAGLMKRLSKQDMEAAERALELVGMHSFQERKMGSLSLGQQQRVLIARALACEPEFLILDEPTVGVDPKAQHSFYNLLESLNKKGIAILLVSHDIGVVSKKASKIACVNQSVSMHSAKAGFGKAIVCAYGEEFTQVPHHHD
ncbi:MAG: ABC transporter ATP-binding protein [Candidatus Anstonellaceae archaeon]